MASASPLSPTFYGHIASTQDALLLFEACLSGALNHVARRPHDRERVSLIKSGNVFIYEEHSSGIKRWTDGVPWSPSRILGNFLVYRELERPFPPGEKKRAMKRSKRSPGIGKQEPYGSSNNSMSGGYSTASAAASSFDAPTASSLSKETERSLIGSLVDSYGFKEEGLVKKTVSVTVGGVSHHLVSYYTVADVMNNKFTTPSKDPRFQHVTPRADLITKQNFRTPIDEVDSMDRIDDRSVYTTFPYGRSGYEMTNQTIAHRPMSLPTPPIGYGSGSSIFSNYAISTHSTPYDSLGQGPATTPYGGQFTQSPGMYSAPKTESYDLGGYRQQRYSSIIGIGSDTARSQMPSVTTNFARRTSNSEHAGSMDSGISGVSSSSSDSKLTNDSGYSSQGFYGGLRDTGNSSHNYTHHRSLPTPTHQSTYDRASVPSYSAPYSSNIKENMWPIGNASAGHGHYMTSQQQWASTGTS
ncbi:Gti1/Pac2 family protein [Hyaloscypha sp. PMI_1271]|nr:Gti1/Pac2 family protein [Hyaloscypha sp. PMI_1271]